MWDLGNRFDLKEKDRCELSNFIEKSYGIKMPPHKKLLLQSRLQKRISQLGFTSIRNYMDYLFSPNGRENELDHFAAIISTHKTEFFREIDHFEVMQSIILPKIVSNTSLGKTETLVAWSAASSTGEEVYSMAMVIDNYFREKGNNFPMFKVIGTDISEDISTIAKRAIYAQGALSSIPQKFFRYLMRSKDPHRQEIRIVPELRRHTDFRPQNLMDSYYKVKEGIHIIFCRNVLIYFDRFTQETILRKILSYLALGGYLCIGHSETLSGMNLPVNQLRPTIYYKVKE